MTKWSYWTPQDLSAALVPLLGCFADMPKPHCEACQERTLLSPADTGPSSKSRQAQPQDHAPPRPKGLSLLSAQVNLQGKLSM